jgi:hypothetical protein
MFLNFLILDNKLLFYNKKTCEVLTSQVSKLILTYQTTT